MFIPTSVVVSTLAIMLFTWYGGLNVLNGQLRLSAYATTLGVFVVIVIGYLEGWLNHPLFNLLVGGLIATSACIQHYNCRRVAPFVLRRVTHLVVAVGLNGPEVVLTAAALRRLLPQVKVRVFAGSTLLAQLNEIMAAWQLPRQARLILVSSGLTGDQRLQFLEFLAASRAQLAGVIETGTLSFWQTEQLASRREWLIKPSELGDGTISLPDILRLELTRCWIRLDRQMNELLAAAEPGSRLSLREDVATALNFSRESTDGVAALINHLAAGGRLVPIDPLV
jgi:hypothetical protein